jgi:hypothetical protein
MTRDKAKPFLVPKLTILLLRQARELNSPSEGCNLPGLLVRLLDQLTNLGETAAQIKKALKTKSFEI